MLQIHATGIYLGNELLMGYRYSILTVASQKSRFDYHHDSCRKRQSNDPLSYICSMHT